MKRKVLKGIYAITPDGLKEEILLRKVSFLLKKGISLVQYRDKNNNKDQKLKLARELQKICSDFDSTFIINDDPLLAKEAKADGVHLGQNDISYKKGRDLLGPEAIIGISCQNNLELALKAESEGANYVSFGSIYPTKTKSNTVECSTAQLRSFVKQITIPCVAIGGITFDNLHEVSSTGVNIFAMSSGLFNKE